MKFRSTQHFVNYLIEGIETEESSINEEERMEEGRSHIKRMGDFYAQQRENEPVPPGAYRDPRSGRLFLPAKDQEHRGYGGIYRDSDEERNRIQAARKAAEEKAKKAKEEAARKAEEEAKKGFFAKLGTSLGKGIEGIKGKLGLEEELKEAIKEAIKESRKRKQ